MLTATIHECPLCNGPIKTEHFAREPLICSREVTQLFCQFCGHGWETLWKLDVGSREEVFSLEFDAKRDPAKLDEFLERLRDNRAA